MAEGHYWERRPGESWQAFEAFRTYRDMGSGRSTALVAQQLGKTKSLIDRWCSPTRGWNWVARVEAYNDFLDREQLRLASERRREAQLRHLRLAQVTLGKFLERIAQLSPEDIPVTMLDRMLRVGTDVELRALGEPTSRVDATLELSLEGEDALLEKLRRMVTDVEDAGEPYWEAPTDDQESILDDNATDDILPD